MNKKNDDIENFLENNKLDVNLIKKLENIRDKFDSSINFYKNNKNEMGKKVLSDVSKNIENEIENNSSQNYNNDLIKELEIIRKKLNSGIDFYKNNKNEMGKKNFNNIFKNIEKILKEKRK